MIKNATLAFYTQTTTYDAENNPVTAWATTRSISGNLQPKSLTESELAQYGVNTKAANAKLFLFDPDTAVVIGTRLGAYNVRAANHWPSHSEAILEPV